MYYSLMCITVELPVLIPKTNMAQASNFPVIPGQLASLPLWVNYLLMQIIFNSFGIMYCNFVCRAIYRVKSMENTIISNQEMLTLNRTLSHFQENRT